MSVLRTTPLKSTEVAGDGASGSVSTARLSWRQVAYYLNGAGFYARRPRSKNGPGRAEGFSLRENGDGSVSITYSSGTAADGSEHARMLEGYANALGDAGIDYDADDRSIVVRGWNER